MSQQPRVIEIDPSRLKFKVRDMIDFEARTGKSIEEAFKGAAEPGARPDWKAIAALVWIIRRRDEPGFTFDDALDTDLDDQSFAALFPTTPADQSAGADAAATAN